MKEHTLAVRRFEIDFHLGDEANNTFTLEVAVYDTARGMRQAMARHEGRPTRELADVGGGLQYDGDSEGHDLGVLRLCREHLTASVLVHESVHVGVRYAHLFYKCDPLRLTRKGRGDREETVAYITQFAFEALAETLADDIEAA